MRELTANLRSIGMDAEKGAAGVGVHLGSAKQTVVLGPLFVLDFGPNYDPSMAK